MNDTRPLIIMLEELIAIYKSFGGQWSDRPKKNEFVEQNIALIHASVKSIRESRIMVFLPQ